MVGKVRERKGKAGQREASAEMKSVRGLSKGLMPCHRLTALAGSIEYTFGFLGSDRCQNVERAKSVSCFLDYSMYA